MMRPEVLSLLRRWREALLGAAIVALGLWWLVTSFGLLRWIGLAVMIGGAALIWTGVQRARFSREADGPGVVRVKEGQIGYYGPFTGGAVSLTEMTRVTLDTGPVPPCWRFTQYGQPDLLIPLNASGADDLFDVFAYLPGVNTGQLVAEVQRAMAGERKAPIVIWDRSHLRLH